MAILPWDHGSDRLAISQQCSLAPGNPSVIAAQSLLTDGDVLAFLTDEQGLNCMGEPRSCRSWRELGYAVSAAPAERTIVGMSSGGICAFVAAWCGHAKQCTPPPSLPLCGTASRRLVGRESRRASRNNASCHTRALSLPLGHTARL